MGTQLDRFYTTILIHCRSKKNKVLTFEFVWLDKLKSSQSPREIETLHTLPLIDQVPQFPKVQGSCI
jgi:hypothetical protein